METRRLLQFIAVARHLSFSRAADALNMSQPVLSQNIRSLERELGFLLFERTKRQVRLTQAGAEYLSGLTAALEELDRCGQRARDAQAGKRGTLRIAAVGVAIFAYIPPIARAFQQKFPDLTIDISVLPNADIVRALRTKRADLIFSSYVDADDEIETRPLWPMQWVVALPVEHPQAKKRIVRLSEFWRDTLYVQPHGEDGVGGHDAVLALCREHGLTPNAIRQAPSRLATQSLLGLVACGFGIAIVPSVYAQIKMPSIVFKQIGPQQKTWRISAAWRRSNASPMVENFVELARKSI